MKKVGGMPNMQQLMKQAQKMQQDMQRAQEELEEAEIEGKSAGGAVTVILNGKKVLQSINIDPSVIDPDDNEMLEDLITEAMNDATKKATSQMEQKMKAITGGISIPGLF